MFSLNQLADNTCTPVASAQVYLPKILNIPVFLADKGAVVKETPVTMSLFLSCVGFIYQIHSKLILGGALWIDVALLSQKMQLEPGKIREEWPRSLVPVQCVLKQSVII